MRVARAGAGEASLYNPLYIHASVGLGKTHLLQAITQCADAAGRRVIYLTAEKFMVSFVSALKAQTAIAFKERLREIEVLVIDDVQFLQGKSIQQEFCHTLNSLIDAGRQIVTAADRPPVDLESLDERVRSRLAGGLCVEMGVLDEYSSKFSKPALLPPRPDSPDSTCRRRSSPISRASFRPTAATSTAPSIGCSPT